MKDLNFSLLFKTKKLIKVHEKEHIVCVIVDEVDSLVNREKKLREII